MGAQDWVTNMVATCAENIRHPMVTEVPFLWAMPSRLMGCGAQEKPVIQP